MSGAGGEDRKFVEFCKGVNGLDKVILREVRGHSAEVYLNGAQVTSWKNEHGEELLFLSTKAVFKPPTAIRGGIPISFPQFGTHGSLEQHGFARNTVWTIDKDPPPFPTASCHKAFVDLILKPSEDDPKSWPHSEVRIEGLETLDYLDNLRDRDRVTEQGDAITFESEVDKVYLSTPTKIAILDHERKRTYVLRKDGLPDAVTVVWNPWDKRAKMIVDLGDAEYKHMLLVGAACVENPITLKSGEEWKGRQELSAVPSSYCSGQLDPEKVVH
ncbi:Putative glucose-6-phosphate 1-epimerase [Linum perenne]